MVALLATEATGDEAASNERNKDNVRLPDATGLLLASNLLPIALRIDVAVVAVAVSDLATPINLDATGLELVRSDLT